MNLNAPRSYLAMILSHNWHYKIDRILRFFCCSRSSELKIFLTPEAEKRSLSCLKFPCTLAKVGVSLCLKHLVIKPTLPAVLCILDVGKRRSMNEMERPCGKKFN